MTKLSSVVCERVVRALQRDGWVVIRRRGSHIRLQKHLENETLKLTIPAHRPIKRTTLAHILKQARMTRNASRHFCDAKRWLQIPYRIGRTGEKRIQPDSFLELLLADDY